jgi:hypothetical protein
MWETRSAAKSQGVEEHPTNNKSRKANWIVDILRRNSLLKQFIEGKIEGKGRIDEMTREKT